MLYVKLVDSVPLIPVKLMNIKFPLEIVLRVAFTVCPDVIGSGNGNGICVTFK
jgi:hypothetical protein